MITQTRIFLAVLSVLLLGSLASAGAQDYEIKLFRAAKVGDKFRLLVNGRNVESMEVLAGGRVLGHKVDQLDVELIAMVTVLDVDDRGRMTKYSLEIENWDIKSPTPTQPLLVPGVVIVAALEGRRYVLRVNNLPLDPLSSRALSIVVPSHNSGVSDDEVFGTAERKKIGDSWPVNREVAARSLRDSVEINVDPGDIVGTSTLEGAVSSGTGDYLVIGATLRVDKLVMSLPDGVRIDRGRITATFSGRLPTDARRLPLNHSIKIVAQFSGTGPANANTPESTFNGRLERIISREFQELK